MVWWEGTVWWEDRDGGRAQVRFGGRLGMEGGYRDGGRAQVRFGGRLGMEGGY
ncbi:3954_t:CDS:2, partial [Acaulospora morrowiae]